MLKVGQAAPPFSLPSTSGRSVSLAALKGRKVVLYFYPRDSTPGCTREACDFGERHAAVLESGALVLGVSGDSLASHEKFRAKHALPFDLLSDAGNRTALAYGAYGEKTLYGKKVTGTIRSTFLIDEQGRIAALWSPVKVDGHADAVLAALQGASAAQTGALRKDAAKPKPASTPARKKS